MPGEPLAIAQVSPYPWGPHHEVNEFVRRVSEELAGRGHRVVVVAPGDPRKELKVLRREVRDSRAAIKRSAERPRSLLTAGKPRVLTIGQAIPLPTGPSRRPPPLPLDVRRSMEQLLDVVPFDLVHVHDPFAPSPGSAALRHSYSLNVASFHEPAERVLSTQVARMLVEMFFGRIDARTASSELTGEMLERFFPGSHELIRPGADVAEPALPRAQDRVRFVYCADEERGALRLFLRALRRLPPDLEWEAVIRHDEGPGDPLGRVSRSLRERLTVVGARAAGREAVIASGDVLCLASGGVRSAPAVARAALAAGTVPVLSDLPLYRELSGDGDRGLLFPPGDAVTLAGQLERLVRDPAQRAEIAGRAREGGEGRPWAEAAGQVEEIYRRLVSARHDPRPKPELRRRLAKRELLDIDLHMHTDHSPDCATPAQLLVDTAKERGLGAIAVTDHNEITGAFEARDIAERDGGLKVIVAEEVKTAHEGEVIGLFLSEKIERGMSLAETIAEIRRQGGLVYVPHPFDRLHSVPDYEHLIKVVADIDIIEVFNPRIAVRSFNEEAVRFSRKYRIVPGAGSDSHVAQGLGSVRIRLRDFEGPAEFLESMREADIVRKHKNLVYVQTLKFLQTSGGRGGRSLAARDGGAAKRTGSRRKRARGTGKK